MGLVGYQARKKKQKKNEVHYIIRQAWKWAVSVTEMEVSRQGCVGSEARP